MRSLPNLVPETRLIMMLVNSQDSASGGTSNLPGERVVLTSAERH